jgi:hypothetical protein
MNIFQKGRETEKLHKKFAPFVSTTTITIKIYAGLIEKVGRKFGFSEFRRKLMPAMANYPQLQFSNELFRTFFVCVCVCVCLGK